MTELPQTVDDWTEGKIRDILKEGFDESETLEFKEIVNSSTNRISKTVCAFTNSVGGIIIFGVSDDRTKSASQRLVGIEKNNDINKKINDQIANIRPNIPIEKIKFKKNYIELENKKVIVIVEIFTSKIGPHQFENIFLKRVNSSNIPMELEEIKSKILESQKSKSYMINFQSQCVMLNDCLEAAQLALKNERWTDMEMMILSIDLEGLRHFLYNRVFLYPNKTRLAVGTVIYELNMLSKHLSKHLTIINKKHESREFGEPTIKRHLERALKELGVIQKELNFKIELPNHSFTNQLKKGLKRKKDNKTGKS